MCTPSTTSISTLELEGPVCMMAASVPPTGESLCMTGQTDGRQTDRQQTKPLCFLLGAASVTKKTKKRYTC